MDSRGKMKTIDEVWKELLASYESAGKNSQTILRLFRDENGNPSGYQIERTRKEMVKIAVN